MTRSTLRWVSVLLLVLATVVLTGCEIGWFLFGKGTQEALFVLPEKGRVLVLVDPSPTSGMTADVPTELGTRISEHLYRYKAADSFVPQYRLAELRKDSARFRRMSVADLARECQADTVVCVYVDVFKVETLSDNQVTNGTAQGFVKVVDSSGQRLWPIEASSDGMPVAARVDYAFREHRGLVEVQKQLVDLFAIRSGRMFHKYDMEDPDVAR